MCSTSVDRQVKNRPFRYITKSVCSKADFHKTEFWNVSSLILLICLVLFEGFLDEKGMKALKQDKKLIPAIFQVFSNE